MKKIIFLILFIVVSTFSGVAIFAQEEEDGLVLIAPETSPLPIEQLIEQPRPLQYPGPLLFTRLLGPTIGPEDVPTIVALVISFLVIFIIIPIFSTQILFLISLFREPKKIARGLVITQAWRALQKNWKFYLLFQIFQSFLAFLFFLLIFATRTIPIVFTLFCGLTFLLFIAMLYVSARVSLLKLDDKPAEILSHLSNLRAACSFGITFIMMLLLLSMIPGLCAVLISVLDYGVPGVNVVLSVIFGISLSIIGVVAFFVGCTRFIFVPFIILDGKFQPLSSIRKSFILSKGKSGELFLLLLLLFSINVLASFILFGVGLFFSIPFTFLTLAGLYRSLKSQDSNVSSTAKQNYTFKKEFKGSGGNSLKT